MATVERRGDGHWVRWKEPVVTVSADGTTTKRWKDRSRTFQSREAAELFKAEREVAAKRGERFVDAREAPTVTLKTLLDWYANAPANERTRRWRKAMIGSFTKWAGEERPAADLSARLLESYASSLPSVGRAASTRHRKVLAVEAMWDAAYDPRVRDRFPGVPEPVRVTAATIADVNAPVHAPPPVVRTAVPDMKDVDAMRKALRSGWRHGEDHGRVALICRYTGLRISHAVNLNWRDIHLDDRAAGPYIVLRTGARGMKKGRARVVPLHPALVDAMAGWGAQEGRVFASTNERWTRGEATREAFRAAWERSGVDRAKWDKPDDEDGERGHGSPTHAIRAALFTTLLREGVTIDLASYLIGHATSATKAAYVPEASPAASPWWEALREASRRIPDHRGRKPTRRPRKRAR